MRSIFAGLGLGGDFWNPQSDSFRLTNSLVLHFSSSSSMIFSSFHRSLGSDSGDTWQILAGVPGPSGSREGFLFGRSFFLLIPASYFSTPARKTIIRMSPKISAPRFLFGEDQKL